MRQPTTRFTMWRMIVLASTLTAGHVSAQQNDSDPETPPRRESPRAETRRLPISLDGGASINPKILTKVKDNTVGLTVDDREAYFRILKLTEKLDPVELRDLALEFKEDRRAASPRYRRRPVEKFPTFVDLFQHPAEYRGRPVTWHGKFRRLVTYSAGKNDQGFHDLYEGWFYADDAQGNPAVIVFTEKPEGLPIGGDLEEEVSVTGYFLKMYGYSAQDTTRRAPLILAQTVRWRPQPELARWNPSPQTYVAFSVGIGILGLIIGLMVRESRWRATAWKEARRAKFEEFAPFDDTPLAKSSAPGQNGSPVEPHH